jgi:hypothetical protein
MTTGRERLREAIEAATFYDEMATTPDARAILLDDLWPILDAALAHDWPSGPGRLNAATAPVIDDWKPDATPGERRVWEAAIRAALSGSSDPEADEDIRADIRQASMGGPDFTPMEWPESDPEAVGLDVERLALLERLYEAALDLNAFATWSVLNRPEVGPFQDALRAVVENGRTRLTEAKPEPPA